MMKTYMIQVIGTGSTPLAAFEDGVANLIEKLPLDVTAMALNVHDYFPTPTFPLYSCSIQVCYCSSEEQQ